MKETSKAMRRRMAEGGMWGHIFKGKGIDIGSGDDPLDLPECIHFDQKDGDANTLSKYFKPESFDYIHASQSLEHMIDPRKAIRDWASCLKVAGCMVITVPDFDIYEKRIWPSRFNHDHKSAWSTWRKGERNVPLVHVPSFLKDLETDSSLQTMICRIVDTNYDWNALEDLDQTFDSDGAECFIEFVLRKIA